MDKDLEKEKKWVLEEKYGGKETAGFWLDVKRLENGEPVDYVIGWKEFLGCRIDLSAKPLIPRVETEFWTNEAIDEIKETLLRSDYGATARQVRVLDLFAGSGCIGISVLKNVPDSFVVFGEKEKIFLEQIKKNLELNEIAESRFEIKEADVFEGIAGRLRPGLRRAKRKFDFILANPPYISESRKELVQKSSLEFEPQSALFAKDSGLYFVEKIIKEAPEFLVDNSRELFHGEGQVFCEFDSVQEEEIRELLEKSKFKNFKIGKDQFGFSRWFSARF